MELDRSYLLAVLEAAAPALSSNKNQLQGMDCFWFDGTSISAYDDLIGIRIEFATTFTGGVSGQKLLGILNNSTAKKVDISGGDDDNLYMVIGAAEVKLALRPLEEIIWEPRLPQSASWPVTEEFIKAMGLTLFSVGTSKILNAEQRGVTLIQDGDIADLYTTDANSLSWAQIRTGDQSPIASGSRVIFPTLFCEQIEAVKLSSPLLTVDENAAYFTGLIKLGNSEEGIGYLLFGRLVEDDTGGVNFSRTVEDNDPGNDGFEVPKRLAMALDRAMVISDAPIKLEIAKGELFLLADEEKTGKVDDNIRLKDAKDHEDISVRIDPKLVRRGVEGRERMSVTKNIIYMWGPKGFVHIVSNR